MNLTPYVKRPAFAYIEHVPIPEIVWGRDSQAWAVSQGFFVEMSDSRERPNIRTWRHSRLVHFFENNNVLDVGKRPDSVMIIQEFRRRMGEHYDPEYFTRTVPLTVTQRHSLPPHPDRTDYMRLGMFIRQQDQHGCRDAWGPGVAVFDRHMRWYHKFKFENQRTAFATARRAAETERIRTIQAKRVETIRANQAFKVDQVIEHLKNPDSDEAAMIRAALKAYGFGEPEELKAHLERQQREHSMHSAYLEARDRKPPRERALAIAAQRREQLNANRRSKRRALKMKQAMDRAKALGKALGDMKAAEGDQQ
jgi:hypothetical protein